MAEIPIEHYPPTENILKDWTHLFYGDRFTTEIRIWIIENMTGDWCIDDVSGFMGCCLFFEVPEDAMAFKLRWQ